MNAGADDIRGSRRGAAATAVRLGALAPWIILFAAAAVRIGQFLGRRSLWFDEALLAANILDRSAAQLMEPLARHQGAPLLFLLPVKAATLFFGTGELALRLLPLLASLASLWLFYRIAREKLDEPFRSAALFIFAFCHPLVYYGQEVKPYALDVAAALLLTWLLLRVEHVRPAGGGVALLAGGVLAIFLSYPSVFVLAGVGTVLLFFSFSRKIDLPPAAAVAIVCVWLLAFGAYYFLLLQDTAADRNLIGFWRRGFLPVPYNLETAGKWVRSAMNFLEFIGYGRGWEIYVTALTTVALVAALARRDALGLSFIVTLAVTLAAATTRRYPFFERLVLFLVPYLILLAIQGLAIATQRRQGAATIVLGLFLLLPALASAFVLSTQPIEREELRPLLDGLQARIGEGDRIYIYHGASPAAGYYLRRYPFERDSILWGLTSERRPARYLEDVARIEACRRVWLIFSHKQPGEEAFILSAIDRPAAEQYHAPGASLYLYDFTGRAR